MKKTLLLLFTFAALSLQAQYTTTLLNTYHPTKSETLVHIDTIILGSSAIDSFPVGHVWIGKSMPSNLRNSIDSFLIERKKTLFPPIDFQIDVVGQKDSIFMVDTLPMNAYWTASPNLIDTARYINIVNENIFVDQLGEHIKKLDRLKPNNVFYKQIERYEEKIDRLLLMIIKLEAEKKKLLLKLKNKK